MKNLTDRNIIKSDNYEFYFNKIPASKGIKIWNDVLTNEVVKIRWLRFISNFIGIIGSAITIYNYISPDTTMRTAGLMAAGASTMLNRKKLVEGYGPPSIFHHGYSYGYGEDGEAWLKTHIGIDPVGVENVNHNEP